MSDRDQLGWRVPTPVWEAFESYVAEKDGSGHVYLQIRLKDAMAEFIEEDTKRTHAAEALRHHRDLHGLSSSSRSFSTSRYHGEDTTKVQHRVDPGLKADFKAFADENDASSYGRMLASALDFWMDGGFDSILTEGVFELTDGGPSSGTTTETDENQSSSVRDSGTTTESDESRLSSHGQRGTSRGTTNDGDNDDDGVAVDPQLVLEAVDELPSADELASRPLRADELRYGVVRGIDPSSDEEIQAYTTACCEHLSLSEHPHKDAYITESFKQSQEIYGCMDRVEATYALRRYAALDLVSQGSLKGGFEYTEVQEMFEANANGGEPSHDHAYTLMELAGEQEGFEYGDYRGTKQLRVDLSAVPESVLEWLQDEAMKPELDKLGVNGRLEDYGAGTPPETEGVADD
ncbi:hypothetical protein V9T20_12595 (plasmid) [Halobacterium salinarum]|uniref:hypothetical protein n=1 Tax=Halobacterium salinarum TaxID=2242 RepID=UPI0030D4E682